MSNAIQRRVVLNALFRSAKAIGAYHALRNEVRTEIIVEEARRLGKSVSLPRVEGERISFYEFTYDKNLVRGRYGIMEPSPQGKPANPDLLIVPGVAFDRCGYRVGYGKGYYDRYLSETPTFCIGLAYSLQVIDKLSWRQHDKRINALATESEFLTFDA